MLCSKQSLLNLEHNLEPSNIGCHADSLPE